MKHQGWIFLNQNYMQNYYESKNKNNESFSIEIIIINLYY